MDDNNMIINELNRQLNDKTVDTIQKLAAALQDDNFRFTKDEDEDFDYSPFWSTRG